MADITMCVGDKCPLRLRERCYRYTAPPNSRSQSMCDFTHHIVPVKNGYECREFLKDTRVPEENKNRRVTDE